MPIAGQHDPLEVNHPIEQLQMGGVEVSRATAPFEADDDARNIVGWAMPDGIVT